MSEDDVDQPEGVEGFEGAEEEVFDEAAEGGGFEPVQAGVDAAVGAGRFFLVVLGEGDGAPVAFEAGADAAEGVGVGVRGDVGGAPDEEFDGEEAEGDDDVDEVAAAAAAEADGWGEPRDDEGGEDGAADGEDGGGDLPGHARVEHLEPVEVAGADYDREASGVAVLEPVAAVAGDEFGFDAGEEGVGDAVVEVSAALAAEVFEEIFGEDFVVETCHPGEVFV